MTSAETAMIPVSRRTIASAISRWRSFGSDSKSRPVSSRSAAPARAASASSETSERQHAVQVVKAVALAAREQQDRAEPDLEHDRHLGDAQRVPEADRRLVAKPGDPAPRPGDQVGRDDRDPDRDVDGDHAQASRRRLGPPPEPANPPEASEIRLLMRKITM